MKQKLQKIVLILLFVVDIVFIIIFSNIEASYTRDNETFYHYIDFYGYFEIQTEREIDVDNSFVNIITEYGKKEKVKLKYEKYTEGSYQFTIYKGDNYQLVDIEVYDISGNLIELKQYEEILEVERLDSKNVMSGLLVFCFIILIIDIVLFVKSIKNKNIRNDTTDSIIKIDIEKKLTEKVECIYCGFENKPSEKKCYSCGANLKSKKGR